MGNVGAFIPRIQLLGRLLLIVTWPLPISERKFQSSKCGERSLPLHLLVLHS
jgi:hypothetical protein